jgi:hypothetical protein
MVVVDGSNLATEGRTTPSFRQLNECVAAFLEENPDFDAIVVVDATFEHRVAASERERVRQAEQSGEIVTPPAGVIGRGDAFILKIARRSNAVVLSNDSFQEFHVEHPWLFDEGRLIGGKPVPKVGWIFTPRNPVRGPKSKTVVKRAAAAAAAVELESQAPRARSTTAKKAAGAATDSQRPKAAAKKAVPTRVEPASRRSGRRAVVAEEPKSPAKGPRGRQVAPRTPVAPAKAARTKAVKAPAKPSSKAPAAAPAAKERVEAVNTPRSFLRLVADHPLGTVVDGEVLQFTSHGAMASIRVGRTMKVVCYAPLAGLGDPTPTRARDVLKKGEVYRFTIVAFDTQRRRAELALAPSS